MRSRSPLLSELSEVSSTDLQDDDVLDNPRSPRDGSHEGSASREMSSRIRSDSRSRGDEHSDHSRPSDNETDDDRMKRPRVPIDKISFGEAGRRSARNFVDEVDFGEAWRVSQGKPPNAGPNQPFVRGRGGFRGSPRGGAMPLPPGPFPSR